MSHGTFCQYRQGEARKQYIGLHTYQNHRQGKRSGILTNTKLYYSKVVKHSFIATE